ncbi:MAG: hypothetical protein INR62_09905, partial [Rhodospirillales bacterium]|nr:hypothetical protein [Acetobacter sp.]
MTGATVASWSEWHPYGTTPGYRVSMAAFPNKQSAREWVAGRAQGRSFAWAGRLLHHHAIEINGENVAWYMASKRSRRKA